MAKVEEWMVEVVYATSNIYPSTTVVMESEPRRFEPWSSQTNDIKINRSTCHHLAWCLVLFRQIDSPLSIQRWTEADVKTVEGLGESIYYLNCLLR